MKKLIALSAILVTLSLLGCSQVVYTHLQAMQQYKTQQDVVKAFGIPSQKKEGNNMSEWLYDESAYSKPARRKDNPVYHSANTNTVTVTEFTGYKKFVKFSFDGQGNVLNYDSAGVDFSKREANPVGTIFLVVFGGLVVVGTAIALAFHGL